MSYSRLTIAGIDADFSTLLPVSVNMAVADVREPDKRNSSYSKTIIVPGTSVTNKIFEYIFEVNIQSNTFNPNVKTAAAYYVNEVRVFNGDLQLLKVKVKKPNGTTEEVNYECSIIGETGNLFLDISNLYLTDIDFSDLDHSLTYASGLFNPTLGTGYCYPYIDYGMNPLAVPLGNTWYFEQLKPAIFEKEYIDRIFEDAGYTYTSTYLNTTYEKSIIIPCVNEGVLKIPEDERLENSFYAGRTSDNTNNYSLTVLGSAWTYGSQINVAPVIFNADSGGTFYDINDNYSTVTGIFTCGIPAWYTISSNLQIQIVAHDPAGTVTRSWTFGGLVSLDKSTDGGTNWASVASIGLSANGTAASSLHPRSVNYPNSQANTGDKFRVRVTINSLSFTFLDGGGSPIVTGTASFDVVIKTGSDYGCIISDPSLQYGGTVVMNDTIPGDVKQLDFLTSILKAENLYMELDKNDPLNYIIEPREDFILTAGSNPLDVKDWTAKLDISKDIEVIPMGDLDAKRYRFTYKSDKDYFNQAYENEFKEVYGSELIDVETDFIKNEKKIELIFSATPGVATAANDIVAPRFFTAESNLQPVKSVQVNIRRLYWGGLTSCAQHFLYVNGSSTIVSTYPYAGHVDDPISPSIDLCFDNPLKLYWAFPGASYTDNNRYNERYSKFISEITDRDSKIVKAYFYLTERDIAEFSFRNPIFVDGTYYSVNKIMDYDPQQPKTVLVELLKIKAGVPFVSTIITPGGGSGSNRVTGGTNSSGNYNMSSGMTIGQNNFNGGDFLIIGDNNTVSGNG